MERVLSDATPNSTDVLLGRGTNINDHAGNIRFRQLISARKAQYLSLSRNHDKDRLAREIGKAVLSSGGRFLKKKVGIPRSKKAVWELADEGTVVLKVKQAMRDNYRKDKIPSHYQKSESPKLGSLASGSQSSTTDEKAVTRPSMRLSRYTFAVVQGSSPSAERAWMQLNEAILQRELSVSHAVTLPPHAAHHIQHPLPESLSLQRTQQFSMSSPSFRGCLLGAEEASSSASLEVTLGVLQQQRNQLLQDQQHALLSHQLNLQSLRLLAIHRQQQQLLRRTQASENARSGMSVATSDLLGAIPDAYDENEVST